MTRAGVPRAVFMACAALLTNFYSAPAPAQGAPGTYEVRKGDGLLAISGKLAYKGVTRFQIVAAIFRANQEAFPDGNINVLKEGQVLKLPSQDAVAAIPAAEASALWRELIARPAPPAPSAAVASVRPPTGSVAPPKPAPGALGRAEQIRRYREGLALERNGDDKAALQAFLEAGESGYGPAQRKLGQIYDRGNSAVARDYSAALKWYQRAREQGMEIPKPFVRSPR
jgi:pilus assembly protein FimV